MVSFVTTSSLKKDAPDYPLMHHQVIGQEALNVGMKHALREGKTTDEFVTEINVAAASVVVAAKGLLRFPELSSRDEQQTVHEMTEYFLLGSFASWLVALGAFVLIV